MNEKQMKKIYRRAGKAEVDELFSFRADHPYKSLQFEGFKWDYLDCGRGEETVLLLPSGIHFGEMWFQVINGLKDRYRVIAPTYPQVNSLTTLLRGIRAVIDKENTGKIHLLGMSTSGWFAQCFVRHYPEQVESLILTNTSGPEVIDVKTLKKVRLFAALFPTQLMKLSHKTYYRNSSLPEGKRLFLEAFLDELRRRTPRGEVLALYDCAIDYAANYSFSPEDLAKWPGRVQIIESDNDEGYNKAMRDALKQLYPQARVKTMLDAGHTPVFTRTAEFINTINNFLNAD